MPDKRINKRRRREIRIQKLPTTAKRLLLQLAKLLPPKVKGVFLAS
jgi:hypothetical protein